MAHGLFQRTTVWPRRGRRAERVSFPVLMHDVARMKKPVVEPALNADRLADRHELPYQRPVARAQSVRPGGAGLGAGHAHVPRLLFDSAAADDVRPHSDTPDRRFANAASRGVLCPRWMTGLGATETGTETSMAGPRRAGTEKEGACSGSVGVIGGTV